MNTNKFRGHDIELVNGEWVYSDNGKSVQDNWKDRPCGYCGLPNTPEGHDGCIGTLPNVQNACCGHGNISEAYIQFENGTRIAGKNAIIWITNIE